jgi:formate hydrogenlyase subunit 6/NADH:ubiquinone oxidoreductase subunit I
MSVNQADSTYFGAIYDVIHTTLKGLIVTIRAWAFDPKQTVQYPDIDIRTGEFRGVAPNPGLGGAIKGALRLDPQPALEFLRMYGDQPRGLKTKQVLNPIINLLYGSLPDAHANGFYESRLSTKIADRYRGILNVDIEICTACLACSRACPIDCIQIDSTKVGKELKLERFDIDIALCMYCGLCSVPCPTGAIHHTKEFEASTTDFPDLIRRYIDEPRMAFKQKKLKAPLGTEPPPDAAAPATPAPAKA